MNLNELLEQAAASWPEKAALIADGATVSYARLVGAILESVSQLKTLNLRPGVRVGLFVPDGIGYVTLTFALWKLEAVVVPIPVDCTPEELAEIATAMRLEGVISHKPLGLNGQAKALSDSYWTKMTPKAAPDNHGLNIAFIRFTSGTTSSRKGVVLCHESVRDRVMAANKSFRIAPEDTVIWRLPMAHHFLITIVLYLSRGATIVLTRDLLASAFLEAVNRWRGTVLYAAPFHYSLLARDRSETLIPSARLAVSTTCALPPETVREFYKRFKLPLVQALGVIELGLVSLNTDDPMGRWNSVGRPSPDFQLRITNRDAEGVGEVEAKGPGMFDAYADPWQSREQVLRDGWFVTGDMGWMDDDGFLFLAGRKTAVINLAGRKVFPEEIEAVLNRHPVVQESWVYGRAHPHLGEVVEAEIVLAKAGGSLEPVKDYCREHLAAYKIPTRLTVVASLPRTAGTGKLLRPAK